MGVGGRCVWSAESKKPTLETCCSRERGGWRLAGGGWGPKWVPRPVAVGSGSQTFSALFSSEVRQALRCTDGASVPIREVWSRVPAVRPSVEFSLGVGGEGRRASDVRGLLSGRKNWVLARAPVRLRGPRTYCATLPLPGPRARVGTACLLCPPPPRLPFWLPPASSFVWVLGVTSWGHGSRRVICTVAGSPVNPPSSPGVRLTSNISGAAALTARGCTLSVGIGCCPSSLPLACDPLPPPVPPAAGKAGGGRGRAGGLPRPASPQWREGGG